MFSVGEYVIYGNHGVCKIEKMGGVSLPLVDGKKKYYTLRPIYKNEAVIYAPVNNPRLMIRSVLTKEEAEQLIEEMPQMERVL